MRARNLAYWGAVALCVEVAAGELVGWLRFALTSDLRGPDFFSYYAASLLLRARGPSQLYDFAAQKLYQDQVTAQWSGHFILLPFITPPWVALLFYPLAWLPYRWSYLAWGASILVLAGLGIAIAVRAAALEGRAALLAAAAAAASLPVLVLLLQGQSDAPMIPALAGAALLWVRGREGAAGAVAALALVKPQLVLLVPVLFLARRSWRALAAFAGTGALLAGLSVAVYGLAACLAWLSVLAPWAFAGHANFPVDAQSQYSLRGLLQLVGLPPALQVAVLAVAGLAVAVVLFRGVHDRRLEFALAVTASVAISPYLHAHDLALLVVPGILLAGTLPELRRRRLGSGILPVGWLGLELITLAPALTALSIVSLVVVLVVVLADARQA